MSAETPEPYVFPVAEAISSLYAEFPELEKTTLVIRSEADVAAHKDKFTRLENDFDDPLERVQNAVAASGPCVVRLRESVKDGFIHSYANAIVMIMDDVLADVKNFMQTRAEDNSYVAVADAEKSPEKWMWACFDHEAGHVLTRAGLAKPLGGNQQLEECMADAYAMLRHYQRFGADSAFPETYAAMRLYHAVNLGTPDHIEHLTSPAIAAVARLNRDVIVTLSPEQTRKLAVKIGLEATFSPDGKYNLSSAFNKAAGGSLAPDNMDSHIRKIADVGRETSSPLVHETVVSYLTSLPKIAVGRAFDAALLEKSLRELKEWMPKPEPLRPLWRRVAARIFGHAPKPPARPHLLLSP